MTPFDPAAGAASNPRKFSINPIQWLATSDGWINPALAPPVDEQLRIVAEAGFTSVKSVVPTGSNVTEYGQKLADHGLVPGPGYVALPWHEDASDRLPFLDRAGALASANVQLGTPLVFLSMGMSQDAPRVRHPAEGHSHALDRLERVRDYIALAAGRISAEGCVAALHPHVGTWVETADEARFVLDTVDEELLKFGPDSGHLAWTGVNPAEVIAEYAPRVAGLHIKDLKMEIARQARIARLDYRSTVLQGLWTEPGRGDADLLELLAAPGPEFDGWVVVEVDRATTSPEESIRYCGEWLTGMLHSSRKGE